MRNRKRELVLNSATWSGTGELVGQPGQLTLNADDRRDAIGLLLNTGCWTEADRPMLENAGDRTLAGLVINSEGSECREDNGPETPTLNYAAFASRRMPAALIQPMVMALIPRPVGQVLDLDCEFDNDAGLTLNFNELASPRLVRHLRDQRDNNGDTDVDPPTLNWAEIASPGLVRNLRRQRNLPDASTDPLDRAGLGARGKPGEVNYTGRPYAEGDVSPGGPALKPEDEEVDEGDEDEGEPRYLHREELNLDTFPDEVDEEMESGRLSSSNPAGMQWGNRDSKPIVQTSRTFSDVLLEQEAQQRQQYMRST